MLGILVWQEGGEFVAPDRVGVVALGRWPGGSCERSARASPLIDPGALQSQYFRLGITAQTLQQIAWVGPMIALPIFLQLALEYNALQAGLSPRRVADHVRRCPVAGRKAGEPRPSKIIRAGFLLSSRLRS